MAQSVYDEHLNQPVSRYARQDFVRVFEDQTVGEALAYVQQSKVGERIVYFYVVDREDHLKGVVPTRRLLLNPPQTPIRDVMVEKVIALPKTATLFDACDLFLFHRLLALPIVDEVGRIVGVVDVELYTDEITDLARGVESDDVFQLIGVRLARIRQGSIPTVIRSRFPWLSANIAGGLAAAALANNYRQILDNVIVLALFIPVVLALAESVGIQSLTLTLQSLHGRRIRWRQALRNIVREIPIGLLLGLGAGLLVAGVAWVWHGRGLVALCIGLSILLSVGTAALLGMVVPTSLRALHRDPKVASGPITLATADLATLFFYLGLATWMLG